MIKLDNHKSFQDIINSFNQCQFTLISFTEDFPKISLGFHWIIFILVHVLQFWIVKALQVSRILFWANCFSKRLTVTKFYSNFWKFLWCSNFTRLNYCSTLIFLGKPYFKCKKLSSFISDATTVLAVFHYFVTESRKWYSG